LISFGQTEGNIFFIGDFDDEAEDRLVIPLTKEIQRQRKARFPRIDLYINSFGGYAHLVDHLIELIEIAKRDEIMVRTIVPSIAFSAGSMLAIAGTEGERYIARRANHLVHYGATGSQESTPVQVDRYYNWKRADFKNVVAHYNNYSNIPDIEDHIADDGFFIPAAKCLKWGLADKYTDKFDIGYEEE
jgi:ATP-dependent protease ClpP protease subunit